MYSNLSLFEFICGGLTDSLIQNFTEWYLKVNLDLIKRNQKEWLWKFNYWVSLTHIHCDIVESHIWARPQLHIHAQSSIIFFSKLAIGYFKSCQIILFFLWRAAGCPVTVKTRLAPYHSQTEHWSESKDPGWVFFPFSDTKYLICSLLGFVLLYSQL